VTEPAQPRTQRIRLGAELRRLRLLSGLSGRELAKRTGISQASISRMENGQVVPSLPEVTAWADAVQAPGDARARLAAMTETALNEVTTFRERLRAGLTAIQQDVRALEATCRTLRHFQPTLVPGLLQTPDYARHVLELADTDPNADIHAAVAARLERQAILYDSRRTSEFIITEAALRWLPAAAPAGMLAAQLDRLAAVAELPHIALGVIPLSAPMKAIPRCAFVLHEDCDAGHQPFVIAEVPHAAIYATDPDDVEVYRELLAALRQSAVSGAEAVSVIRATAAALLARCGGSR